MTLVISTVSAISKTVSILINFQKVNKKDHQIIYFLYIYMYTKTNHQFDTKLTVATLKYSYNHAHEHTKQTLFCPIETVIKLLT
jgi:hypothetical protein